MVMVKSAEKRNVKSGRPKTPKQTEDDVVRMYNDDYPVDAICSAYNISRSTVYRILRDRRNDAEEETKG